MIGIGSETYSCASSPVQMAAKVAYENYQQMEDYLFRQTSILRDIGNYCADRLRKAQLKVHAPRGAFYLFPDFRAYQERMNQKGIFGSTQMCKRLLEDTGVALLPAAAFGFSEDFLAARLAYVDFEDPVQKLTFDVLLDCPRVVQGLNRIEKWLLSL